jgi:wobble nucleotide-excising tRNase
MKLTWGEIRWYGFMNKWASQKHFTANNQSLVVTSAAEIRWYGFMNKWASQKHFTTNNQSLVVTSAAAIALTTMSWFFLWHCTLQLQGGLQRN